MLQKITVFLVLGLFLGSVGVNADMNSKQFAEMKSDGLNWEKSVVQVTGFGIAPDYITNTAHAKIMAREAAITTAQRRLLETISGVQIDSRQTIKNVQVQSDIINKRVAGLIKGAQIIKERPIDDKTYMVVMKLKFYGQDGVIKAIFPTLAEDTRKESEVTNDINQKNSNSKKFDYTGIIINASGLNLKPALAPKIYDSRENLIYGVNKVARQQVIEDGIVAYSRSLADARNNPRIGKKPIIINAKKVVGRYKTDLVLSVRNGVLMKRVGQNGIFRKCKVIIVVD